MNAKLMMFTPGAALLLLLLPASSLWGGGSAMTQPGTPAVLTDTFTSGDTAPSALPVDLGLAGRFVILAKAGISTVPTSAITGNLGISPAPATYITGFALTMDASNRFSTSSQVTGKVYAADYAPPTPATLTTAVLDMETAFRDAAGRTPDVTELGAGNIGGMTLAPGVYKWGTNLLIPTDVTLAGAATDVWIFQIAQDLIVSSATSVILAGGALPENVFWQVTGLVELGTTAQFNGIILTATAIRVQTGASVNGRLFAQTAVSLDGNIIVEPVSGPPPVSPVLSVYNMVGGQTGLVEVTGATPGGMVIMGTSLAGGGPISTIYGTVMLSPPIYTRAVFADAVGTATISRQVYAHLSGKTLYFHAVDDSTNALTNALSVVVG